MARNKQTNGFVIDPNTRQEDRVYIGEGHKLIDNPSRSQMHRRFKLGIVVIKTRKRLRCPHRRDTRGFWTTVAADQWFNEELNRQEGIA